MTREQGNTKVKLRNAEIHDGGTCRKDDGMGPAGVTRINMYTVSSALTNGNSIAQPLKVKKVGEITKTSFLNLLKDFRVFFLNQLVNTTQKRI